MLTRSPSAACCCWRIGDLLGRKRVFAVGLGVFVVASALCGLASGIGLDKCADVPARR